VPLTDEYLGSLPFPEAQTALGGTVEQQKYVARVGWHHTYFDPRLGSYAIVRSDGPLAHLVGERLKITYRTRSVYAYVIDEGEPAEDLSLTRRTFLALQLLPADELRCAIEIVGGETTEEVPITNDLGFPLVVTLTPGLQSYWRLDEPASYTQVSDFVGGIHGNVGSAVDLGQAGVVPSLSDTSAYFDTTSNDYIDFGDVYQFNGTVPFSSMIVVAPDAGQTDGRKRILWHPSGPSPWHWWIDFASGNIKWGFERMSGNNAATPTYQPVATQPYMLVGTYDGTTLRLYVNGVLQAPTTTDAVAIPSATAGDLRLGYHSSFGGRSKHRIGHVAIFNTAITQAQVTALYAAFVA
jgi:hypothetical protein